MRVAVVASAAGHVGLLLWGMIAFVIKPLDAQTMEALPIDIVSASDFSQMTAGVKTAPKVTTPKPMVEKVAPPKPTEETSKPVEKKPEVQMASAEPPKPAEPKPEAAPKESKAEPAPPDPALEAMKREEQKRKEEKKKAEEQKRREEQKKREQATFDPAKIAALLDKRQPQRQLASGDILNQTASLGLPHGAAMQLSQSELDALRAQIQANWNVPAGAAEARDLYVEVRLQLRQDGTLAADPMVLNRLSHPYFQVFAESGLRAIRRGQPYRLPVAKYEIWRDVVVRFDPREMFGR